MKKIKLILTYLIAFVCVLSLFFQPKNISVVHPISNRVFEDEGIIYVLDAENMIVPITVTYQKNINNEDNIKTLIQLMQQNLEVTGFETLLPQSLHFSQVTIHEQQVTINVNEAFYTMNSTLELRVIEGLVGVVLQFDPSYEVSFRVNGEMAKQMPLSRLPLVSLNHKLGYNNFKSTQSNLHQSQSFHEVILKQQDERFYYIIQTKRITNDLTDEQLMALMIQPVRTYVSFCKIEEDRAILSLTEKALIDESSVDLEIIKPLLFTLHFMKNLQKFQFIVNNEIVEVLGNKDSIIEIQQISLNRFEL